MIVFISAESSHSHNIGKVSVAVILITPSPAKIMMAALSQRTPVPKPMQTLLNGLEMICISIFRFSISQKIRVKPTTHRNGISSAQNLQTAPFEESGIGNNQAKTAHPTKKKIAFVPVINNSTFPADIRKQRLYKLGL